MANSRVTVLAVLLGVVCALTIRVSSRSIEPLRHESQVFEKDPSAVGSRLARSSEDDDSTSDSSEESLSSSSSSSDEDESQDSDSESDSGPPNIVTAMVPPAPTTMTNGGNEPDSG
eukprot:scpid102471/ scgid16490/ 